jgi:VWFA-related protein
VKTGVTAVLVDVVVRDKRGQPVRDMQPSDFQVLEDGVPQTIGSFTRMFDGAVMVAPPAAVAAPTPAAAVGAPAPVSAGPAVTALVFDRVNPEARRRAVQAAQDYLGMNEQAADYIGVFGIDLALTSYAPFTRNREALRQALDKIASRSSASFNSQDQQEQKAAADQRAASAEQAMARVEAAAGPGPSQAMGGAPAEALFAEMQAKMIRDFEVMERDQQGYATTNGLLAIVGTLRRLPGRKSLVFFSEGVAIPPAVERLFRGVVDAANRANVSIYTMDAAGLRAESEQAKIRDLVNQAARVGIETSRSSGSNDAPLTKRLEKNEDVLRQDPRTGLAELAQDTGGLAFDNTNNLRQGFERIETDLRNYYLIGYASADDTYDGRFRTIEVRVKRPGVTVAARKGYYAVRDPGGVAINPWEAPALAALEQKSVPNAFPIRAGALLFPERGRPGLVPVIADVSTAGLTFQPAEDGNTYSSDFTVLVRFLDQQNQVVRQVSQHYEVKGPRADLERARQGEIIFYREPELPAGVYTMETVAYDAPSGKSSVRVSTVEVTKADSSRLRMSSLVLVKRSEKVAANERRDDNPLLVKDVVLYPNLGEPVSKAAREVGFYFAIYPAADQAAPESTIQLLQNGRLLANLPMPLAAREPAGRIPQVGRLPLDQLAPGTYELRAVVKQGGEQVARFTLLRVTE